MTRNPPIPDEITVVTDTREKQGWVFPQSFTYTPGAGYPFQKEIRVVSVGGELLEGDYRIRGWEKVVCIERKGSLNELRTNLFTADRPRFISALVRMMKCTKHPVLALDIPMISTTYNLPPMKNFPNLPEAPGTILDELYRVAASLHTMGQGLYPLEVMWVGGSLRKSETKWATGVQMLRYMWSKVWQEMMENTGPQRATEENRE